MANGLLFCFFATVLLTLCRNSSGTTYDGRNLGLQSLPTDIPADTMDLILSGIDLSGTDPDVFVETMTGLNDLKFLDLSSTELTRVPDFYSENEHFNLDIIKLTGNPLVCNAETLWLKDVMENPCLNTVVSAGTCSGPPQVAGREWTTLTREELNGTGKCALSSSICLIRRPTQSVIRGC